VRGDLAVALAAVGLLGVLGDVFLRGCLGRGGLELQRERGGGVGAAARALRRGVAGALVGVLGRHLGAHLDGPAAPAVGHGEADAVDRIGGVALLGRQRLRDGALAAVRAALAAAVLTLRTARLRRGRLGVARIAAARTVVRGQRVHAAADAREHRHGRGDGYRRAHSAPRAAGLRTRIRSGARREPRGTPYRARLRGADLLRPCPTVPPALRGGAVICLPGIGIPAGGSRLRHGSTV
jgi:hypothetical protein